MPLQSLGAAPATATDAATKGYVDSTTAPLSWPIMQARQTLAQTIGATTTILTNWIMEFGALYDPARFNATTGIYTVDWTGIMEFSGVLNLTTVPTSTASAAVYLRRGTTSLTQVYLQGQSTSIPPFRVPCTAGQAFNMAFYNNSGTNLTTYTANAYGASFCCFQRVG